MSAARQARQDRQLRRLVGQLRGCLNALPPQAQRVLSLRAGIGSARPYSQSEVAHILRVSAVREDQIESSALVDLRSLALADGCGAASSAANGGTSLVAMLATLPRLGTFQPGNGTSTATASTTSLPGARAHHPQPAVSRGNAIYNASVAGPPTSSSDSSVVILLGLLSLGLLGLMGLGARRLRHSPRLTSFGAAAPPPAEHRAAFLAPSPREPEVRDWSVADEPVAPVAPPGFVPAPSSNGREALAGGQTNGAGRADEQPPVPVGSEVAGPVSPSVPAVRPRTEPSWLRTHASQVALIVTAVGGALRLVVRGRGNGTRARGKHHRRG